jgi:type II secretory pathway pseudopilin PulG
MPKRNKIFNVLPINRQKGFTLIETLLYIAFFAFLMGSLLGITFQTIASTDQINKKIVLQQESNFILRKMDWALTGASAVATGPLASDISITRYTAPATVIFSQHGNFIDVNTGAGAVDLNSTNTVVSNLVFTKTVNANEPAEIQASFKLSYITDPANSETFSLTKYLKQ